MSAIFTITRKELRTAFLSPVALIFLGAFLLVTLFCFFWVEGFFARGLADVRPLFEWLPLLLVFLVSALGMRLWAEERRQGTLEVLFTFPIPTWQLVLGKFLAGMGLIAVALALTLGLPVTVAALGDLDVGPVAGGYLAALLLGAAYLSIALWLSSLTDNAIVALLVAVLACGLLYLLGTPAVAGLFGRETGELLRALGTSSRFDSIGRGVVDLRDLVYYLSLAGFFLALNVASLHALRWSRGPQRRKARINAVGSVVLLGLNLAALNVVLAPVHGIRLDLTEDREYSISPVTRRLLEQVDEPLLIRGYFSDKTHPLLAPLVPRIRDTIEEYGAVGGPNVTVEFVDPSGDEELEKDAMQLYGIETTPFRFSDRHEHSVVNAYFTVLIKYGDQFETLSWGDLIEVEAGETGIDVRLRNLEYDLTRAIQKTIYGFASVETVFAQLPDDAKVTFYITPSTLPEAFAEVPEHVQAVLDELQGRSAGRFTHETVDLDAEGGDEKRQELYERYGLQPLAMSFFDREGFYLHLVLEVGDRQERIVPADAMSEANIRTELVAALKRSTPASLKTVGLAIGGDPTPQQTMPGMPPQSGQLSFRTLREVLSETYRVKSVDLQSGRVPGDVDVLILLDPKEMSDAEVFALDQFLMRGGSAIVAAGRFAMQPPSPMGGLQVAQVDTGLDAALSSYGLAIGKEIVLDERNAPFPIPVVRNLGGIRMREIRMVDYAPFVDVRSDQMARDNPALAGLPGVVMHWSSPTEILAGETGDGGASGEPVYETLLRSSDRAWTLTSFDANPDYEAHPDLGFSKGSATEAHPLAVAVRGSLDSHFKDRAPPSFGSGDEDATADEDRSVSVIESSPDTARLVLLGSGSFVSDPVLRLGQDLSDAFLPNLQLVHNLVDWSLEDVELLSIRSRGAYARRLQLDEENDSRIWEWGNYGFALLAVVAIGSGMWLRRRAQPLPLDPPRKQTRSRRAA